MCKYRTRHPRLRLRVLWKRIHPLYITYYYNVSRNLPSRGYRDAHTSVRSDLCLSVELRKGKSNDFMVFYFTHLRLNFLIVLCFRTRAHLFITILYYIVYVVHTRLITTERRSSSDPDYLYRHYDKKNLQKNIIWMHII